MALTPDERHAITDLFDRMRENGLADKDAEAEALINQLARRTPDSLYMLAQSVLIQEAQIAEYEEYMDQQEARIREMEEQLAGGRGSAPPSSGGGGFLGGRGRTERSAAPEPRYDDGRSSGIPPIGSRSGPSPYETQQQAPAGSPWAGRGGAPSMPSGPMGAPSQGQPMPQQAQAGGGGGFLKTAAAMAAGVAGGALLGNALGGMFGGNKGEAHAGQSGSSSGSQNSSSTGNDPGYQSADDNDPGNTSSNTHDAGYDEGGDWGVGGGGDDGIEI